MARWDGMILQELFYILRFEDMTEKWQPSSKGNPLTPQELENLMLLRRKMREGERSEMLPNTYSPQSDTLKFSLRRLREHFTLWRKFHRIKTAALPDREKEVLQTKFSETAQQVLVAGKQMMEKYGWSQNPTPHTYNLAEKLYGDNKYANSLMRTAITGKSYDENMGLRQKDTLILRVLFNPLSDIRDKGNKLPGTDYWTKLSAFTIEFAKQLGYILPDEKVNTDNKRMNVPTSFTEGTTVTADIPHPTDPTLSLHLILEDPRINKHNETIVAKGLEISYHRPKT